MNAFEITVVKPGFEGDLEDADRSQFGAFAPAARVRVDGAAHVAADISLVPMETP
ncbi:MAG: hypothetical protein U0414_27530 [Polyangiaceae bacterium]